MSSENNNQGIGVLGLLGVVFVTLKLVGVINWSWWYVTMPFWGGAVLWIAIILFVVVIKIIAEVAKKGSR